MKTPKFITQLSAVIAARSKKKLRATARTAPRAAMDSYEADEPTTKLSSAFIVVLILHVVAVGGIYAFNSIKASRSSRVAAPTTAAETPKPPATNDIKAPVQAGSPSSVTATHPAESTVAVAPVPAVASAKPATPKPYIVKAGDNPTKIAFAYNLKTDELLVANNLKDGTVLRPGQILTIPAPKPATKPVAVEPHKAEIPVKATDVPPTRTTPGKHIVKKGDTATSIAKTYGLTAEEILKFNKITDAKKLQLGQTLNIPPKKG